MRQDMTVRELLEQSEDEVFRRLIDEQEGALGVAESMESGQSPSPQALARWSRELDRRSAPVRRGRLLRRIAAVAILAALAVAFAAAAYHAEINNFLISVQERFTEIKAAAPPEDIISQWDSAYLPQSIPRGYFVSDAHDNGDMRLIEYANAEGDRITFYQYRSAGIRIDTEDVDEDTLCSIGPYQGAFVKKDEVCILYWIIGEDLLSLEFNDPPISAETAIEMAENIQIEREET